MGLITYTIRACYHEKNALDKQHSVLFLEESGRWNMFDRRGTFRTSAPDRGGSKSPTTQLRRGICTSRKNWSACALMEQVLLGIAGSKVRICFHAWLELWVRSTFRSQTSKTTCQQNALIGKIRLKGKWNMSNRSDEYTLYSADRHSLCKHFKIHQQNSRSIVNLRL